MTNAQVIGQIILKACENEPRNDAIDALAMAVLTYLHVGEEEFFSSRIIEASRDHVARSVN